MIVNFLYMVNCAGCKILQMACDIICAIVVNEGLCYAIAGCGLCFLSTEQRSRSESSKQL